ncbi:MAG: YdeI/OmpD-associated family protein [Puniceicoccales bacterium]|jgi:hypothetical protein|nr:YdeI/OmpD-associated family protein [Puniceicoccales bacterium]
MITLEEPFSIGPDCFYPKDSGQWRSWLMENGSHFRGIWLIVPKKSSGLPGITYLQALEEALCFGWIDGIAKGRGPLLMSHRMSPRARNSSWSEVNKQHVRLLIAAGKMAPSGMAVLPDLDPTSYRPAEDILAALRQDPTVWENFCAFPIYYRNIRLAAIDRLRSSQEHFDRALAYFIGQTKKNRRYGRFR